MRTFTCLSLLLVLLAACVAPGATLPPADNSSANNPPAKPTGAPPSLVPPTEAPPQPAPTLDTPPQPAPPATALPATALPTSTAPALETSEMVMAWNDGRNRHEFYALDLATGKALEEKSPIAVGANYVHALSADGSRLAVLSFSGEVCDAYMGGTRCRPAHGTFHVYDLQTWQAMSATLPTSGWVWPMVYSPDGTRLALAVENLGSRSLIVLDATTGEALAERPIEFMPELLAFSPDSKRLIAFGTPIADDLTQPGPPRVLLLNADTLDVTFEHVLDGVLSGFWCQANCEDTHGKQLYAQWTPGAVLAPGGDVLYVVHPDADRLTTVNLTNQRVDTVDIRAPLSTLDWLLSLTAGVAEAKGGSEGVGKSAVVSPDGTRLYVTGMASHATQNEEGYWEPSLEPLGLQVVDVQTGRLLAEREGGAQGVRISQDGAYLLLSSWGEYGMDTDVYEAGSLELVVQLKNWEVGALRELDGRPVLLATRPGDGQSRLGVLDLATGEAIQSWVVSGYTSWLVAPFLDGRP